LGKKTLAISTIFFLIVIIYFDLSDTDVHLQDKFYWFEKKRWFFDDPTQIYHLLFYKLIKIPIYIIGFFALYKSIYGKIKKLPFQTYRHFFIIFLTLAILPLSIATIGKKAINVQCPSDVPRYGGTVPYVKLFERYPLNPNSPNGKWPEGHCWPAGHASGGFALFSLFLLARNKKEKILSIIFALAFAVPMSIYQMVRGAHYISHHLTTMLLALMLVSFLNIIIKKEN
jgi:membrane-associated PAP2 superfamily phosphatase